MIFRPIAKGFFGFFVCWAGNMVSGIYDADIVCGLVREIFSFLICDDRPTME